jgi:hypothetical protein
MLHYRSLTQEILDRSVEGPGIKKGPLRKQYNPEKPVLMVFLRHLGCQFCKETVRDIRAASIRNPDYPDVLFFFPEDAATGQAFFNQYWPRAKGISDPGQFFYNEFGIPSAGILNLFRPGVLLASLRAALKGNVSSLPRGIEWLTGKVWQMPGFFVVKGDQIVWSHDYVHIGDEPPLRRINQLLHSIARGKSHQGSTGQSAGKSSSTASSTASSLQAGPRSLERAG